MLDGLQSWIKVRKNTTPVHWLYGSFCAFLILTDGILLGWLAMAAFALLERWNDREERINNPSCKVSGCADWWESFCAFIPGHGIVSLLGYLGIVEVTWL